MTPAPRKTAPSFDVAREPIPRTQSGWVYRSDAPPDPVRSPQPTVVEADWRVVHDAAPAVSPPPAALAPPRHRAESRFHPDAPLPPDRSWFATGLYLMALPMTLGMTLMFAPVSWMLSARSKR